MPHGYLGQEVSGFEPVGSLEPGTHPPACTARACYEKGVRLALLIAIVGLPGLVGCPSSQTSECATDSDCDGTVCARDNTCRGADEVRGVTVTWTIDGMAASEPLCAGNELYVEFDDLSTGQTLGFEPVPCASGKFFVDKLPYDYTTIEVGPIGRGLSKTAPIDSQGAASVDLRF